MRETELETILPSEAENDLRNDDLGDEDYPLPSHFDFSLDDLNNLNITDTNEVKCLLDFIRDPYPLTDYEQLDTSSFCNSTWDGILCWPTTVAGSTSVLPCVDELNGIKYDTTQNATRVCLSNGTWANYSNYKSCVPLPTEPADTSVGISEDTITIYFTGYTISVLALSVALWIFIYFKDLRCLRNTIHAHLLVTYIMADLLWIVTATLQLRIGETNTGSCIIVIFLHYFHLTNFFWMFVEGFYLYMLVVETFSADKIKLRIYAVIGWGIPLPVVIIWAIVKANWHSYPSADGQKLDLDSFLSNCPWMAPNSYDWIYMTPPIIVLFVNILFLVKIMWVLITKLRSANSVETQQYRKGSKALLVLIPLLGLTYVLVIAGPTQGMIAVIFSHIRAVLLSTQGFSVTLFYCFLNTEVRNTVRHHWERWRTSRRVGRSRRRGTRCTREGSRTFSESTRLYSGFQDRSHKRDISMSEVTTVATFPPGSIAIHLNSTTGNNGNGYSAIVSARLSNGSSLMGTSGRFSGDSANLLIKENQV